MVTLRRELHGFIDAIPGRHLMALKPLLANLAEPDDTDALIIETDLTESERKICIEGEKHFREHPEDFISLDDFWRTARTMCRRSRRSRTGGRAKRRREQAAKSLKNVEVVKLKINGGVQRA